MIFLFHVLHHLRGLNHHRSR